MFLTDTVTYTVNLSGLYYIVCFGVTTEKQKPLKNQGLLFCIDYNVLLMEARVGNDLNSITNRNYNANNHSKV